MPHLCAIYDLPDTYFLTFQNEPKTNIPEPPTLFTMVKLLSLQMTFEQLEQPTFVVEQLFIYSRNTGKTQTAVVFHDC